MSETKSTKRRKVVSRIPTVAAKAAHAGGRPPLLRLSLPVIRGPIGSFLSYQSLVRLSSVCRELLHIPHQRRDELATLVLPLLDRVCSGQCLFGQRDCTSSMYVPKFRPHNQCLHRMSFSAKCKNLGAIAKANSSSKYYCLTVSSKFSPAKQLQNVLERVRRTLASNWFGDKPGSLVVTSAVKAWMVEKQLGDGRVFDAM